LSGSIPGHGRPLIARLWEYQKERFPIARHGLLIVTFTFSAASYSRICRRADGFIAPDEFIVGAFTAIILFLLLRIFDEFKDAEDDARYRPYRPVPRGLVSLRELRRLGIVVIALVLALNALVMPAMLWAFLVALGYMALMTKEFFVPAWLKRRPIIYMLSHMVIMPLVDLYTTGLDWINAAVAPPRGLEFFLMVTFLNGIVIEVGRKIRAAEAEETGVETYSALYGPKRAAIGWLAVLSLTCLSAVLAAWYAGFGAWGFIVLTAVLAACGIPAVAFIRSLQGRHAKLIETAAGIWTIAMYLTLGALPMLLRWLGE